MMPRFRAWGKKENKMFDVMSLGLAKGAKTELWSPIRYHHLSVVPSILKKDFILMQSTGLTDKNGKEIFEGDIVRLNTRGNPRWVAIVERFGSGLVLIDEDDDRTKLEYTTCIIPRVGIFNGRNHMQVIGNIHENPELLKDVES